jgi:hypothetical protein
VEDVDAAASVDFPGAAWAISSWLVALDSTAVTPLQADKRKTDTIKTLVILISCFLILSFHFYD